MAKSVRNRRRQFGTGCLMVAAAMLVLGQTLLKPYLDEALFILYWLTCFVLTGLSLITALFEAHAVRREAREEQLDLLRDALEKTDKTTKSKSD